MNDIPNIYDLTHDELVLRMREMKQKAYRATQLFGWLYVKRVDDFDSMSNLPSKFLEHLNDEFNLQLPEIIEEHLSEDESRKFLLELDDGARIESVLIPHDERNTICISTQVGCRFGCTFCATGKMGFTRNLDPGEITGQLLSIERRFGIRIDNIVVMGMGEPLDNLDNLLKAIAIFTHPEALAMSPRRITVSTVGIPDAMRLLKHRHPRLGLSLSLNASNPELRRELMPVEKTHSTPSLIAAMKLINPGRQDAVTVEYVLLEGVNDSPGNARELCELLKEIDNVKVNLIPYNPSGDVDYKRPSRAAVEEFQSIVRRGGYECFIRRSAGSDISGACGQLITGGI